MNCYHCFMIEGFICKTEITGFIILDNILKKNYSEVFDDLFLVDPMSSKVPEAQDIINQIKA